jgi:hypothetical protein
MRYTLHARGVLHTVTACGMLKACIACLADKGSGIATRP